MLVYPTHAYAYTQAGALAVSHARDTKGEKTSGMGREGRNEKEHKQHTATG